MGRQETYAIFIMQYVPSIRRCTHTRFVILESSRRKIADSVPGLLRQQTPIEQLKSIDKFRLRCEWIAR